MGRYRSLRITPGFPEVARLAPDKTRAETPRQGASRRLPAVAGLGFVEMVNSEWKTSYKTLNNS